MHLGQTSTTGDDEGIKASVSDNRPDKSELQTALEHFTGEIMQTPPAYSAIKVNGQRAYALARAGKQVHIEPRSVKIYSLQLKGYRYPSAKFTAKVSSGTYIRSLVEDIGKHLRIGAYMSNLFRTQVGDFKVAEAIQVNQVDANTLNERLLRIRS